MNWYLWFKWLHIIAVISWMAGILYLYRILINHKERGTEHLEIHELLSGMEERLYRIITFPAMCVAVVAGIAMILLAPEMLRMGWLHVKLTAVFFLILSTLWAKHLQKIGAADPHALPTSKTLRIMNEVPALLMMIIVGMVVFKAF